MRRGDALELGHPPPVLVLLEEPWDERLAALFPSPAQLPLRLLHGRLRLRRGDHVFREDRVCQVLP